MNDPRQNDDHGGHPPEGGPRSGMTRRELLQHAAVMGISVSAVGPLLAACGGSSPTSSASASASAPVPGGRLRVGMSSGGPTDTLDPGKIISGVDYARAWNLFDPLAYFDRHMAVKLSLAESFEPNADGTVWTIRLRPGVTWHDGKSLTVDDVIYTLRRNQRLGVVGVQASQIIDFSKVKRVDSLTVEVPLKAPRGDFTVDLADVSVIQDGATDFSQPIGTGPFKFVSWSPGQSSLFEKNPDYFISGQPYLDELEIITIGDATSRLNALQSGQVDAIDQVTFNSARQYKDTTAFKLLQSPSGPYVPITMRCDAAPFNDVRVRQAMRLIADRQAMVNVAQSGFGEIGNDLAGQGLVDYAGDIPQRTQDIDQAKALLNAAGQSGLAITLNTSNFHAGMLESATVFAEQAKSAGVKVTVNNIPPANFYGPQYLKYVFGMSEWIPLPVVSVMSLALASGAPYNETHWENEQFQSLYSEARASLDAAKRKDLLFEAQKVLWDEGGYLIWGFQPYIDAVSNSVTTPPPSPVQPLCASEFRSFWMS